MDTSAIEWGLPQSLLVVRSAAHAQQQAAEFPDTAGSLPATLAHLLEPGGQSVQDRHLVGLQVVGATDNVTV